MQKYKFAGTVERQVVNKGSKSEHEAIVLRPEGAADSHIQIRLQGANPFSDATLDQFLGKRVAFEGTAPVNNVVIVEKLSDISVITPPMRQPKETTAQGCNFLT